jgi:predicted amino acid dehydrogenase
VVCDISRPTNVSPEVRCDREDVLVVDGGVVELPRGSALGLRTSLEPGRAYACMAETILLALEKRYEDTSLGFDLDLDTIFELGHLAERHGLTPVLHNPPRLRWQLLPRTSIGH